MASILSVQIVGSGVAQDPLYHAPSGETRFDFYIKSIVWFNTAMAMAAAAVRFSTCNLLRMCSTCLQIVPLDALRMTLMSWLLLPAAIHRSTSTSRGVRPSDIKPSFFLLMKDISRFFFPLFTRTTGSLAREFVRNYAYLQTSRQYL